MKKKLETLYYPAFFPPPNRQPPHSSPSSIPYWRQIHWTAAGGRSCCCGVTPHWINCSFCCFNQRPKVLVLTPAACASSYL
ncbi:MAG: hypothetical protein IJL35_04495 [Bacteroidaceae bacterium]|nr:hypothetical protein [Bacteroidaceae bacterium]